MSEVKRSQQSHGRLASLMRINFPKRPLGASLNILSNLYDAPLVLYPCPYFWQCIALFAFAEGWLLLDIGIFVLFFFLVFFRGGVGKMDSTIRVC